MEIKVENKRKKKTAMLSPLLTCIWLLAPEGLSEINYGNH